MAGSFKHIVSTTGHFTMEQIDNMGDAYEALEECFFLINFLAAATWPLTTDKDETVKQRIEVALEVFYKTKAE